MVFTPQGSCETDLKSARSNLWTDRLAILILLCWSIAEAPFSSGGARMLIATTDPFSTW